MVGGALSLWLVQRVSAVVLALYSLLMPLWLLWHAPHDYQDWRALFQPQPVRIATLLFMLALALHAWVGMRDIFMDYVKPLGVRLTLHVAALLWLAACVVWAAVILWGLA